MRKHGVPILLSCPLVLGLGLGLNAQSEHAIAIEHITVIDGTGHPPIADATVLAEHDRIEQVARGEILLPAGTRSIDGRGKYESRTNHRAVGTRLTGELQSVGCTSYSIPYVSDRER